MFCIVPLVNIDTGQIWNSAVGHVPKYAHLSDKRMYSRRPVHMETCKKNLYSMVSVRTDTCHMKLVHNAMCHYSHGYDEKYNSTSRVFIYRCQEIVCIVCYQSIRSGGNRKFLQCCKSQSAQL